MKFSVLKFVAANIVLTSTILTGCSDPTQNLTNALAQTELSIPSIEAAIANDTTQLAIALKSAIRDNERNTSPSSLNKVRALWSQWLENKNGNRNQTQTTLESGSSTLLEGQSNAPTLAASTSNTTAAIEPVLMQNNLASTLTAASLAVTTTSLVTTTEVAQLSIQPVNSISSTVGTPGAIELEDWSNGSPVTIGRVNLDKEMADLVWDDPDLKSEMGTVTLRGVSRGIVFKGFEFGAISFASSIAGEGSSPLHQVLIGAKPYGRWGTYPFADTFNPLTDITTPPAFKIKLYSNTGNLLHTFQMRDGKPINDPTLSQTRNVGTGALRPFFNVGMLLPWQSKLPKVSSKLSTLLPGFDKNFPESRGKAHYTSNGAMPLLRIGADGRQQTNGLNHWHAMDKWPLAANENGNLSLDPFAFDVSSTWTGSGNQTNMPWVTGWGYEPGSVSGHDWLTGPGGVRFDRSVVPAPLAYLTTNPNYQRPRDRTPIRELANEWGLAYFNHAGHYIQDVTSFNPILPNEVERKSSSHLNGYYGKGPFAPLSKSIDMRGIRNGDYVLESNNGGTATEFFLDKNGNRFWNGWLLDLHHLHQTPYWYSIAVASPMHIIASRAAFNQSFLARLGMQRIDMRPTNQWTAGNSNATINSRVQAYRWMHYALMWKVAANHPLSISRTEIEGEFIRDLVEWHDNLLVPIQANQSNPYHQAIKKLGIPIRAEQRSNGWYVLTEGTAINFYHANVFMILKSLGLWDRLRSNPKAKATLDFVADSMNKFSNDFILDTDGRAEDPNGTITIAGPFARFEDITAESIPDWKQWGLQNPAIGRENWIRSEDGRLIERYAPMHLRAQWSIMISDWFPEFGSTRSTAAAAKYKLFYSEWKAAIDAIPLPRSKGAADFKMQTLPYSPFAPPNQ